MSGRRRWLAWGGLLALGAIWLAAIAVRDLLGRMAFPTVVRGARPADGRPVSGAAIAPDMLAAWLPPAPADALAYAIDEPLFNGSAVTLKRRWLWVPAGQAIVVDSRTGAVHVPIGTRFWKEFYLHLDTPLDEQSAGERRPGEQRSGDRRSGDSHAGGEEQLIERRILERVADDDGFLGWKFYKAHHLPQVPAHRLHLEAAGRDAARSIVPWFFRSDDWMPTQRVPQAVAIEIGGASAASARAGYVFPGTAQCVTCHAGATGWYARGSDSLAFGLTDLLADPERRARLKQRGWLEDDTDIVAAAPAGAMPDETRQLVKMLRHNCMTCHNAGPNALGRRTGFVLDPRIDYSAADLLALWSRPGLMMGTATRPIVTPGRPDESELMLRLRGEQGRRRMPPEEGGVHGLHARLIEQAERWIRTAGQAAAVAPRGASVPPSDPSSDARRHTGRSEP